MLQQRVGDPTGQSINGVWVSPMRDIAHCFPILVRRAIEAATDNDICDDVELQKEFGEYATKLAKAVKGCVGEDSCENVQELFKRAGILDTRPEIRTLFNKWLMRTMFGMYFQSVREAVHPGEAPIGIDTLLKLVVPVDSE